MRVKLVVSYDGTDFSGWSAQTGRRTVQGTLTEAVRQVSGEDVEISGASRTDGGAHARGQVCHFDTNVSIPVEKWSHVLNRVLGQDVAVVSARKVSDDFSSRFWALDRYYRYRIGVGLRDPQRSRFVHHYGRPLDVEAMERAAGALLGTHDFRAFTEELEPHVINTTRRLMRFDVRRVRDEVWVDVVGTAFLRGMMRRMAGALLEVGRGKRPVEEVSRLLDIEKRSSLQWPVVLPANGLCLMRVRYERHPRDCRQSTGSGSSEPESADC
jgi:tRNA pseudouridine38-40 synthase